MQHVKRNVLLAAALALCAFRLERQRRRHILKRLDAVAVAIADVARHPGCS